MSRGVLSEAGMTAKGRCCNMGQKPMLSIAARTASPSGCVGSMVAPEMTPEPEGTTSTRRIRRFSPRTGSCTVPAMPLTNLISGFFLSVKRTSPAFTSAPALTAMRGTKPWKSVGWIEKRSEAGRSWDAPWTPPFRRMSKPFRILTVAGMSLVTC